MSGRSIPLRNLARRPLRTAALVLIVAFLVCSMFGGSVIVASLQGGMHSLENRLGADVIAMPKTARSQTDFEAMLLEGTPGYFYMNSGVVPQIEQIEGVEQVSAQYFLASASAGCCSVPLQIIGFEPETDFSIQPWIEQSYRKSLGLCELVAGCQITTPVGGTIMLYGVECKVIARLAETGTALDTAVFGTADTVKRLIAGSQEQGISVLADNNPDQVVSSVYIKVQEGYDPQDVTDAINLHVRGASAVRTKSMLTGISDSLSAISGTVTMLICIMWVMCLVIMVLTFSMMMNERKKEFAILRTIGTSRRMLSRILLTESLLISLGGGVIGIVLTSLVVFPFSHAIEAQLGLPFLLPGAGTLAVFILGALAAAAVIGPVTSAYAAYRLSRVDPGVILREGN